MQIHSKSAAETAAQLAEQAFGNVKQNQPGTQPGVETTIAQAWSGLALSQTGDTSEMDSSGADQALEALKQAMLSNSATAWSAQSGANPQSALTLLQ